MKQVVVDFVRLLREAGVPVTTLEAANCLAAFELVGFEPAWLRTVLQTTLVKSAWELPVFNSLFELFFAFAPAPDNEKVPSEPMIIPGGTADGSGRGTAGAGGDASGFLELIKDQPSAVLEDLARQFISDVSLDEATPKEIAVKLRLAQVALSWFQAVNRIERLYATGKMTESSYRQWLERFELLQQAMRLELERNAVRKFGRSAILPLVSDANIRRRQFSHLSSDEVTAVEQEIAKLARKLAERPGIRMRRCRHGRVDLRQTFRDVVRTGGCPIRLRYRNNVKSKVDLFLLCDVSNSVERFSRFMLQLVRAAQKRYATVRSFVFVDQVVEVTEWFRSQNVNELLEARHMRDQFSRTGLSRYDQAFEQVARAELTNITSRTKVIVLGDARNNWRKGDPEELAKIAERAQAVYWLNPLPEEEWSQGDCLMSEYEPYCRQVFECRNLEQLTHIANRIL